jgi:hypothetical protein
LALFALALQIVVSFGHMHRDDLGLPPLSGAEQTQIAASVAAGHPAGQHQQPASDDYCPICASIALLATAMPAVPPVLVTLQAIGYVPPPLASLQRLASQVALSFQARAPPAA